VTDLAAFSVTAHVMSETVSQPVQPVKVAPGAGTAMSLTTVPLS